MTSVAEDLAGGSLWVAGFNTPEIPAWPSPTQAPFYLLCLAQVPPGAAAGQAVSLSDALTHDLALPSALLWTPAAR